MRKWRCIESYNPNFVAGNIYATNDDGGGVRGKDGFVYSQHINSFARANFVEVKEKEHDGCVDCNYEHESCNTEPCYKCSQYYTQPNSNSDLWEEKIKDETQEQTQELPGPIRPNHYKSCSIECIDAMILTFGTDAVAEFCLINAFKYIWRHNDKNGLEDLNKASWYVGISAELDGDIGKVESFTYIINKLREVIEDGKES